MQSGTGSMSEADISLYEVARLERIQENKKLIQDLFPEGTELLPLAADNKQPLTPEESEDCLSASKSKYSRRQLRYNVSRRNPRRRVNSPLLSGDYYDGPITRSMRKDKPKNELVNGLTDEKEFYRVVYTKKRRVILEEEDPLIELDGLPACDQRLLRNVLYNTKQKVYDRHNGTTCHQCRQKTRDQKTLCHNKNCNGTRGQFCGPCLKNRYGEDVRQSLLNSEWVCPPCRGKCNCSFCLPKKGRPPTGIMIHIAKEAGFDSVQEYLEGSNYEY